ncbi:tyrosine-type recombinase/integrase [Cytobacillus horneckiae]|uniref:tyrosine-type recombinase/integrase n=1 Tax=Cytobacillus horneckiae TaxID=549687 RepID=UPI003D252530
MKHLFPDYVEDYNEALVSKGLKQSTLKQYSSDLGKFLNWMDTYKGSVDINTLRSLSGQDLETYVKYLSDNGISDATFRRLLSVLNQFLNHQGVNTGSILNKPKERPLRSLNEYDFISNEEMAELLISMSKPNSSTARDYLIERNLAIVYLARYYGFTPRDISSITMDKINLAQKTIEVSTNRIIKLKDEHIRYIRIYRNSIEKTIRPRLRSKDPLFVSFLNRTCSFQFDYATGMPKGLSIRGIQEMIKDEVRLAGLRKISAKHLRNSCIIDHLSKGSSIRTIISYFQLSDPFSIRRYKEYFNNKVNQ